MARDWYHSAQQIRKSEEDDKRDSMDEDNEDDNALSFSQTTLEEVPEEGRESASNPRSKPIRPLPAHESATNDLSCCG